jgi:hypothetical protein
MKVFISWSGDLSLQVANLISTWLENVLQGIETWISTDDIEKGSFWFPEISNQLKETNFGILCVTSDNLNAPWLLFEAGALSKGLSKSRVTPFLINISTSDLKPPLSNFNATLPHKEDVLKLIKDIASKEEKPLSDVKIVSSFEKWWCDFEKGLGEILTKYIPQDEIPKRTTEDMIKEILEITRSLKRNDSSVVDIFRNHYGLKSGYLPTSDIPATIEKIGNSPMDATSDNHIIRRKDLDAAIRGLLEGKMPVAKEELEPKFDIDPDMRFVPNSKKG